MDDLRGWQAALQRWGQHHTKTISDQLRQLREDFVQHFPVDRLKDMTLDQYAVGKPDSFCYWLEFKTKVLGDIRGGSAAKFGIWWSKSEERWRWNSIYQNAEDALACLTRGLQTLADVANTGRFDELDKIGKELLGPNRYSLRAKPLFLYFPDYFLPISNPEPLKKFLNWFGQQPKGDLLALNRQLLVHLQSLPQFAGFDTFQMMVFLYESMLPKKEGAIPTETQKPEQSIVPPASPASSRTKIFISHSAENKEEFQRLLTHLKAAKFHQPIPIDWWDDTQIKPGANWFDEIQRAITLTRIAILLVSVDYLASNSIIENELPPLLAASE